MAKRTNRAFVADLVATGLTRRQAERTLRAMLRHVAEALARGDEVRLRGFGRFSTRRRPFHWRQTPGDGEIVRVPERTHVVFSPGAELRAAADASPDDPYFDQLVAHRRAISRYLLSQPEVDPPVHDAQFDLGIAYREMGMSERALAKFRSALSLLDESERGARYVRCCYMLGLCYKDAGQFELAAAWFRSGLEAPRRPQAERIELHFQLGVLFGLEGRVEEAIGELEKVSSANPSFRGVSGHIRSLEALRLARQVHG